jgi:hypothetical protein
LAELWLLLIGNATDDGTRHATYGRADRTADDCTTNSTRSRTGGSTTRLRECSSRGESGENNAGKKDLLRHELTPE